ncbi:nitroreductase family protein [Peribacillus tepidiphilus]|jgi:nitroreductase|uniref:nitroreductase family protein n=1 Tax=Peribacillus tepidiphilus TaxID=2652445 RepID=UPI001292967C|nr:nitroreductase family protein [Peribacillus tepidiphilus]
MTNLEKVIEARRSVKVFDPEVTISKEELTKILELAGKAPSAWNLQHWHFAVFANKEVQEKLLPIAYNQIQVKDASAVIAVLGDLEADKKVDSVFGPAVEAGMMKPEIKEVLNNQIKGAYQDKEYAKLAAYSNASLAAMQFMLVAQERGWDTCPIGGFNVQQFIETFKIDARYTPVMLIALGKQKQPGRPSGRLPISELTTWY